MPGKFHLALLIALLGWTNVAAAAECDLAAISKALDAPLEAMKPYEREVAEQQSTEGGVWEIYREKDGRLNTVIRIDAGEMGRSDTRLSVVDRAAWGISSTISEYNRHAIAEGGGPLAVVKKITVYYFFCGGKLHTPPPEWSTTGDEYAAAAGGAKDTFFKAPEIAEFIKGLVR